MMEWFVARKLVLNQRTTNILKSIVADSPHGALNTGYKEVHVEEVVNTNFLSWQIDNHIKWKTDIDQMILKLSGTCYAARLVFRQR
jgi:hypothetical protein